MKTYKLYLLIAIAAIALAITLPEQEYPTSIISFTLCGLINMCFAIIFYDQEKNEK
jgi:hypothetical protein